MAVPTGLEAHERRGGDSVSMAAERGRRDHGVRAGLGNASMGPGRSGGGQGGAVTVADGCDGEATMTYSDEGKLKIEVGDG